MRRVLFVSKPIVPPWHDGSKNLVRDVATSLTAFAPTVLTTPESPDVAGATGWPVYATSGRFAPSLEANARVLAALVRAHGFDVWHFVFAPNAASSTAARLAIRAGRVRGVRRVVQTVASRPKRFEGVRALLFGDVVVALSEWTRARLLAHGAVGRRLVVIPPCARPPRTTTPEEIAEVRARFTLGEGPVVVYPGDLEVSSGAQTMLSAVPDIARRIPEARVVFACRRKTARAADAEARLVAEAKALGVADQCRFVGELPELAPLLAAASSVALPADDLYGKVDVPLVVVEALAAGLPLVLARGGPLETVTTASFVEPGDGAALAEHVVLQLRGGAPVREAVQAGQALYRATFAPAAVAARYEAVYE